MKTKSKPKRQPKPKPDLNAVDLRILEAVMRQPGLSVRDLVPIAERSVMACWASMENEKIAKEEPDIQREIVAAEDPAKALRLSKEVSEGIKAGGEAPKTNEEEESKPKKWTREPVGVLESENAINCLCRIPKNDPHLPVVKQSLTTARRLIRPTIQSESIPLPEAVFPAKSLPRPLQSSPPLDGVGATAAKHPRETGAHHQGEDDLDHAVTPVSA